MLLKSLRDRLYLLRQKRKKLKKFHEAFARFKHASKLKRFDISDKDIRAKLDENTEETGFDRHYIYHTGWAARKIKTLQPEVHIDLSSSLYFISICSAFTKIKFYDYRPPNLVLDNLESKFADLTNLPFEDNSVMSLSCMHVVEHVGLGRYGDPLDPEGDLKAMEELKRVVAKNGSLFFVTPIGGEPRIYFNAHRVYTKEMILDYFKDFSLEEFTLIPQHAKDGGLIKDPSEELLRRQQYGCGCFWLKKTNIF